MTDLTGLSAGCGKRAVGLDPEIREFARTVQEAYSRHEMADDTPVERAREIAEAVRKPWTRGGPIMADTTERFVPRRGGAVRIRVHTPPAAEQGPALLYLHGGGWTLFSLDTHDRLMREYAARSGLRVIGVDYSLSPEARFPQAIEECCAVVRWLRENGASLGVNAARLAIGGDSAGGNLAMATCLTLRDAGDPALPRGMLLNYGVYDANAAHSGAYIETPPGFTLTHEEMRDFWRNYLRGPQDADNTRADLLRADLRGLPPAMMVIAECDTLYAENIAMAEKLRMSGVPVDARVYAGTTHSFLEAVSIAAVAGRALDESVAWLRSLPGLH